MATQFRPLGIRTVDLGAIREAFQDQYPDVTEHPRKPPMAVEAGTRELTVGITDGTVLPNLYFTSPTGDELVQFQDDRLVVNWRRHPNKEYPRYEDAIRPRFINAWERLSKSIEPLGIPAPQPNVCEIAYVNMIDSGVTWSTHAETSNVIAPWSGEYSDDFLPPAEEVRVGARYNLPGDLGQLVIEANPVRRSDDGRPAIMLHLAARGEARQPNLDGTLEFFDLAREWIVKGFVSFTSPEMHEEWGQR